MNNTEASVAEGSFKHWPSLCLIGILTAAAAMRLWGIRWGLPGPDHLFSYHPDEFHSLRGAINLAVRGDPNPHFFNYGTFYIHLVALIGFFFAHPEHGIGPYLLELTWCARLLTVAFGVLTVWVVYAAGTRLYSRTVGLLSAAALAAFPLHVVHSHYATVDVPMTFWVSLCLYASAGIMHGGRWGDYALAGAAVGLAAGTKYGGGVALVAPLVAQWLHVHGQAGEGPRWRRFFDRRLLLCVGLAPLAFVAVCPYSVLAWGEFRDGFLYEVRHMRQGEYPACAVEPSGLLFHFRALGLGLGAPLTAVVAGGGVALAVARRGRADLLVLGALVAFGVSVVSTRVRYMRYDVVLLPFLALLVGGLLAALWDLAGRAGVKGTARALAGVLLAGPLIYSVGAAGCYVAAMARPDPRDQALEWLRTHARVGDSVALVWQPWFNAPPVDYVNGGDVLRRNPSFAGLIRSPWVIQVVGYNAGKLQAERPDYLILGEIELRDFVRAREPGALALLGAAKQEYELAARFVRRPAGPAWMRNPPQDWLYPFPAIKILRLKERRSGSAH